MSRLLMGLVLAVPLSLHSFAADAADNMQGEDAGNLRPGTAAGIQDAQLFSNPTVEYVSLAAVAAVLIAVAASKGGQSTSATNTN